MITKSTIGIFADLNNTFDAIVHDILLSNLHHYGIRGLALDWLHSYVGNSSQFLQISNEKSSTSQIVCGQPKAQYWAQSFSTYASMIFVAHEIW